MNANEAKKKYKSSITFEIVGMIAVCIILFATIYSYVSFQIYNGIIKSQMETLIENTCFIARDCVNGDFFDEYLESNGESESSQLALSLMQRVCNDTKFNYLYLIRPDFENGKVLNSLSVHGDMYDNLETYDVGVVTDITAEDYDIAYRQIMDGEKDIAFVYRLDMPYTNRYNDHITGLAPIKNSNGDVVGIMCAEMTFAWYQDSLRFYQVNAIKWLAIILLAGVAVCSLLIRFRVVRPFIAIAKETDRFARTNQLAGTPIADVVKRRNELGLLASSVDQMENQTLQNISDITRMTADRERLNAEFDIASRIQAAALPHEFPPFPDRSEFEIYASMTPAKEVGGDFYDFFLIDDDHLALVIADVSGKGVPAALFMMISKILIDNYSELTPDPVQILEMVNSKLAENNEVEMFVTVWLAILEISTGTLRTVNAGHEDPVIMRNGQDFEVSKEKHGFVVGGMEGTKYKVQEYRLSYGDTVFIYTDGVTEATNENDELYGMTRMVNALNSCRQESNLELLAQHIRDDVNEFVNGAPQFDDMTMLIMRYCK